MRFRAGTAKAPTPSGMNSTMTLVCSKSAWVAYAISGIGSVIWKFSLRARSSYADSANEAIFGNDGSTRS